MVLVNGTSLGMRSMVLVNCTSLGMRSMVLAGNEVNGTGQWY